MKNKNVKIELLQGENSPLVFAENIESRKLNEVAGTLAFRILKLREKAKKYGMKLGFSFARKFDVRITIDGVSASGTEDEFKSMVKFGITVQSNEKSMEKFHSFIKDLVLSILAGEGQQEGTYKSLKGELLNGKTPSVSAGAKMHLKNLQRVAELN